MSDSEMVEGILRGTVDFAVLMNRHRGAVYRGFCCWTRNSALAEELTQCLFIRAWKKLAYFDPTRGSFRTWLYRIAYNIYRDWGRHESLEPVESLDAMDEKDGPTCPGQGLAQAVMRAVEKLSPNHHYVIKACVLEGLTHEEAAKQRGVNVRTIERWLSEATALLRRVV